MQRKADEFMLNAVVTPQTFTAMQQVLEDVYVHPDIGRYVVDLTTKTRHHRQVVIGASPRGSLALLKLIRAWAAIQGRDYVLPDDVKRFAQEALCHRVILEPNLWGSKTTQNTVVAEIVNSVAVPVIPFEHE
jgi:MoxR-like ATPase